MPTDKIELTINWYKLIINIEKVTIQETPKQERPPQTKTSIIPIYKPLDIKRKYYKKGEPWYNRRPNGYWKERSQEYINQKIYKRLSTLTSKILKSDMIVKQEPLLDFHY